jgi:hypothetical protein
VDCDLTARKAYRIRCLFSSFPNPASTSTPLGRSGEAFLQGLRELGYVEGHNYVAEVLLQAEGFTDLQCVTIPADVAAAQALAAGELDFTHYTAGLAAFHSQARDPFLLLAGLHLDCYELFGTDRVHTIRDLKGKTVVLPQPQDSAAHILPASMAA